MIRFIIVSVLSTAAVWALAGKAYAGPWELGRAQAVANKAWGSPCGGRPQIIYSEDNAGKYDAWVYFTRIPGEAAVPECRVYLGEHMREAEWNHVCRVILHEWGHLTGILEHSADPNSIMATIPPDDIRCSKRGRAYLGLAEPRTAALRARFA